MIFVQVTHFQTDEDDACYADGEGTCYSCNTTGESSNGDDEAHSYFTGYESDEEVDTTKPGDKVHAYFI